MKPLVTSFRRFALPTRFFNYFRSFICVNRKKIVILQGLNINNDYGKQ